jgi:hypothetical protein
MSEAINLKTRRNPRQCGDLEARRAGEIIAWGGAKRSPENAKSILVADLDAAIWKPEGQAR